MNKKEFKNIITSKEYDFLITNERLKNNICLLTLGGSYAYGTNIDTPEYKSDIDIRGFTLNSKSDLLGFSNFEQFINESTDTVIYSFNKLVKLLLDCNPNCIEMLSPREDVYYCNDIGQSLINMRHKFLSKRAGRTFGGYANQQLRRLENALCHDIYKNEDEKRHMFGSMQNSFAHLIEIYNIDSKGTFEIKQDSNGDALLDINLHNVPLNDMRSIFMVNNEIAKTYNKLNGRNKKKDDIHLNKHAMHLVRLYLMAIDIFEKEEIVTYRKKDIPLLMSIRNGDYQKKDGTFRSEFFEMVNDYEAKFKYALKNTSLPDKPNIKFIEEFVMEVNSKVVK